MRFYRSWALLLLILLPLCASAAPTDAEVEATYRDLFSKVQAPRIARTYTQLSRFETRIAGSAGELAVLQHAESEFRRLGLQNIRKEPFDVTIPDPDAKGSLSGRGWTATIWPLWPNLVRTSTC